MTRRFRPNALLEPKYEHRILGLMLLSLHVAIWWDYGGSLSRPLMLAHIGLFLIWQPLWGHQRTLDARSGLVFLGVTSAFVAWLDWGLMTFWLLLLTALIGGRVTLSRADRFAHLLALVFLVLELLIGCIPPMVKITALAPEAGLIFSYAVPLVPLGLMFIPTGQSTGRRTASVDFLYGLTISLLTAVLGLGSLLSMYLTGSDYPTAVIQTILGIAVFLLAISWLWAPLAGFGGLGQFWERYLQNIGTPFEQWLGRLAELAREESSPDEFLAATIAQVVELPWVAGVDWSGHGVTESLGVATKHDFRTRVGGYVVAVYVHRPMGTALALHGRLLLRLIGHFYTAKVREEEMTRQAHLRAIYETGARVTHDIKNLLQTMHTMTAAIQTTDAERRERGVRMLERQLPHLSARLQLALDKLQAPESVEVAERSLGDWWDEFRDRNGGQDINFDSRIDADRMIPAELFDSVVENLLENARSKRQSEPGLEIRVRLEADRAGTTLSVWDSGSPIPPDLAGKLFKGPIPSRNGLGIGLYQAATHARKLGYELKLGETGGSGVRFDLTSVTANDNPGHESNQ